MAIKVKELIELLQQEDPDKLVIMSKDGKGNSFSPLADYSRQYHYRPDSTWSGELYGYEDDEEPYEPEPGDSPCIVLWPTN